MPTSQNLSTLVINKVESEEVYNYMKNNQLLNDNELYLTPDTSVDSKIYYITLTKGTDGTYTADKTAIEILAAYNAGQAVVIKDTEKGLLAPLAKISEDGQFIVFTIVGGNKNYVYTYDNETWSCDVTILVSNQWTDSDEGSYLKINSNGEVAIGDISYPVTSVNGQTGAVQIDTTIDDEQIDSAVGTYLSAHPELTTTVADGSITSDKLSPELAEGLGIEQHTITEVSVPLIEYTYNTWTPAAGGTNNGIAPILMPQKFRFTNPSTDKDVTISSTLIQFMNEENPETATIYDSGKINELKQWVIPAGKTVEFETYEYGRTSAKYIRFRWTNWPRVLLNVTAIYDSYVPVAQKLDTESDYLKDFPTQWMLQAMHSTLTWRQGFCVVPFYPDTDYYLYKSETTYGAAGTRMPTIFGLPDDSFLTTQDKYINVKGGISINCNVHVYKNVATTDNTVAGAEYLKITTKSWDETMGCKYLAIAMGKYAQHMRYDAPVDTVLDTATIKNFFDEKDATMSPHPFVSRFDLKIDRSIYAQIIIANPNLPDDGGTKSLAMAKMGASPLNNAKWTLFGDSLTDTYGGHDLLSNYFASKIAKEFGMELDNRAKSGSNIYRGGSGNYVNVSGMIKLDEFVSELEAGTIEQPDYITIAFGTNSFTTELGSNEDTSETDTTVYGATKKFIETLRKKCPNSVFGFVLSPKQDWGTNDAQNKRAVDAARTAIKTVCEEYGVPYIDMSTQSGITVDMLPDGIHISNAQSQNLYYHAMRRFMIGL